MFKQKNQLYLSVFIFFWALFALTNNGIDLSEGRYHYLLAEQIIKYGRLDFDSVPPDSVFTLAPNGKYYASHEIGNTLFLLPTTAINIFIEKVLSLFTTKGITRIKDFIVSFQAGFYSAVCATTFFAILQTRFFLPIASCFLATLCLVFTTFFWTYSRNLFDGVLCSTLLTLSIFFLFNFRLNKNNLFLVSAFIFLGFGFITRLSIIIAIFLSLIYVITIRGTFLLKFKRVGIATLTLIPFIIWQFWYNQIRTGVFYLSPVQTPQYVINNGLDGNLLVGVLGYLLSPGKSIFVYAPLLLLSLILFHRFYKSYRYEAIYILSIFILWLLLHGKMRSWYGAWGWGPRYFIIILPILFIPFASHIDLIIKKVFFRLIAIVLGTFGFALAISSMMSNWLVRIDYAIQNKTFDDREFVWGFWNSQSVDMLRAGLENLMRIITNSPVPEKAKIYPGQIEYVSNTINIWLNYNGTKLPLIIRALPLIFLCFLMYIALRNIFRYEYAKSG
ncbi:hypothetical protein [Iningainema tapete]|uniref:Glycosyltransferase RgtA/B/C/D-like domain-containing protein n=1 Tax=Iningainema tapete BLCC-T55 TaxID=2748662 RepID=A0A8J6XIB7_9CYAN|nr:hypothetical protein [Iningainema tapete]MBD2777350.1 hypothetical protein [Iningainema tapete BLCC-T55]